MSHRPPATFDRADRLRTTAEFRAVYGHRARVADTRLVVYARPNGRDRTRLGLSVGKRCGNAVRRNRVKRWIREVFRRHRHEWPEGVDLVVVPLSGDLDFGQVEKALTTMVPRAARRAEKKAGETREDRP